MADNPHLLYIAEVENDGRVRWGVSCPWEPDQRTRDCLYGMEPDTPCAWMLWEDGSHHPDCDGDCIGTQVLDNQSGVQACWPETPSECDGFQSVEGEHCHPSDGCGIEHWLEEAGMGDGVYLNRDVTLPDIPLKVTVRWEDHALTLEVVE